jgi:hypothetical protein
MRKFWKLSRIEWEDYIVLKWMALALDIVALVYILRLFLFGAIGLFPMIESGYMSNEEWGTVLYLLKYSFKSLPIPACCLVMSELLVLLVRLERNTRRD